jgi:CHRD domain
MTTRTMLAVFAGFVALTGLSLAQAATSTEAAKTKICHRAKTGKKPYVKLTVGKSVLKGHLKHAADIIPAPAGPCPTVVLSPTQGGTELHATLTGANEVPGPGDADGTGSALIRLRLGEARLCFQLTAASITLPASAAHIHHGASGVAGPVVVPLTAPGAGGTSQGCVVTTRMLVAAILGTPAGYYANVHTSDFPAGAIRGQLSP